MRCRPTGAALPTVIPSVERGTWAGGDTQDSPPTRNPDTPRHVKPCMQLLAFILDLVLLTGTIGPAVIVVAYLGWFFGLRDPFLLTVTALALGGLLGWALNIVLEKVVTNGKRGGPSTPAAPPPQSQSDM